MVGVQEFNDLLRKIKYDEQARERFFFEYYNKIRLHVQYKYGNFPDWEDIVHDVTEKLIQSDWTEYPYIENPMSWLYSVADNHAKDMLKKFNRIGTFKEESYSEFNIDYIEIRGDVLEAMKKLSRDTQYVLYNQFWLGKKLKTVAAEMGKSYVSVRAIASRGRKKLGKILTKYM